MLVSIFKAICITLVTNLIIALLYFFVRLLGTLVFTKNKKDNFPGLYKCTYLTWKKQDGTHKEFNELIYILKFNKKYYGFLLWRQIAGDVFNIKNPIFRLEGKKHAENLYIGFWLHPDKEDARAGGFTLFVEPKGNDYSGCWSGWDRKRAKINNGTWNWQRSEIKLSNINFLFLLLRRKNYDNFANTNNLRERNVSIR